MGGKKRIKWSELCNSKYITYTCKFVNRLTVAMYSFVPIVFIVFDYKHKVNEALHNVCLQIVKCKWYRTHHIALQFVD